MKISIEIKHCDRIAVEELVREINPNGASCSALRRKRTQQKNLLNRILAAVQDNRISRLRAKLREALKAKLQKEAA